MQAQLTTAFLLLLLHSKRIWANRRDKSMPCDPREFYDDEEEKPEHYWQCVPAMKQVGEWRLERCPEGQFFVKRVQKCISTSLRRQYLPSAGCTQQTNCPQAIAAQPCQASNANPYVGGQCSWMSASLYPSPAQNNFMQCTPTAQASPCGSWQQMACAGGTQYNPQLQVCVTSSLQGTCTQPQYQAVCGCGQQYQCPSSCQCQMGTCCQPTIVTAPPPVFPQLPMCPPVNGGQAKLAISQCTSSLACPQPQYRCEPGINGCCEAPIPICPTGQPASSICAGSGAGSCLQGMTCQNGGCCPIPLPICSTTGGQASVACQGAGVGSCPNGQYCENGGCCPLPVCPDGQPSVAVCTPGGACPGGRICQNGGCCVPPLPQCPDGGPAVATCSGPGTCSTSQYCFEQGPARGCCNIPICAGGGVAIQPCGNPQFPTCPGNNFQCVAGGCCPIPLPTCPSGTPASVTCSGACPSSGEFCYTDGAGVSGCCPIPLCPTGLQAIQPCYDNPNGCPAQQGGSAYQCINGGCCPLPVCPDGQVSQQRCTGPSECGVGMSCQNGACCPVSCPSGLIPTMLCGLNGCPAGSQCYMNQCCPVPIPTCPNGQQAVSPCSVGAPNSCPGGYGCQNGGCCLLQVAPPQPSCPYVQQPLCHCASFNNACPYQSTCSQGTCCAGAASPMYNTVRPGDPCGGQGQCPGLATCTQGYCVCAGNSRSNGVTCLAYNRMKRGLLRYKPSDQCTQFGTPCRKYESAVRIVRDADGTVRRKEPSAKDIGIDVDTEPLFWHPINSTGFCEKAEDCTPDMTCLDHKCYPLMLPGDKGCERDEQCEETATGSECRREGNPGSPRGCHCRPGRKEFDRKCWTECPTEASRPEGDKCIPITMEQTSLGAFAKRIVSLFSPTEKNRH